MFANLDYVVWVKWADRFERWEAFASEGKAQSEARKLSAEYGVEAFPAHHSINNPFSATV